jgi:hypothetical protein
MFKATAHSFLSTLACVLVALAAASQAAAEQLGLEVVQNGRVIQASETPDRVKAFALSHGPFELRASRIIEGGIKKNLGGALFEICASKERSVYEGIAVGMSVAAMPCLNGAAIMARAQDEPKEAVELMLSKGDGNNAFDESNTVLTSTSTIVKVGRITDFVVVGKRCFGVSGKQRCIDQTRDVAFEGDTAYLVIFTDLNGDRAVNEGEFSLVRLAFQGSDRRPSKPLDQPR